MKLSADPDRELSQHFLREVFDYDPETGTAFYRVRPESHFASQAAANAMNGKLAGKRIGSNKRHVSGRVMIDRINYSIPQLFYAHQTGIWCDVIAPRDGDYRNLRFQNLTPVTECQLYWYLRGLRRHERLQLPFMKRDREWLVTSTFCQTEFRRYFKDRSAAFSLANRIWEGGSALILNQDPRKLSDKPLFALLQKEFDSEGSPKL